MKIETKKNSQHKKDLFFSKENKIEKNYNCCQEIKKNNEQCKNPKLRGYDYCERHI